MNGLQSPTLRLLELAGVGSCSDSSSASSRRSKIKNLEDYIDKIKNYGFKVGIAIKPETDIEKIYYLLDKINLVLIMSVEPGKSGQKFIDVSDKINKLKQEIINRKLNVKISVDGGINEEVLTYVKEADILVSSSFILSDLDKNVDILKNS